tara:strand:+ start:260 stop:4633 length:4374 start_codon:yes stop_codon:yes gene_type:complete
MKGHINTYTGLNKDVAFDSIEPKFYIDALDIRITTTVGESQGAFSNMKGNKLSFVIPKQGSFNSVTWNATGIPEVIGYGTIRETIILYVADDSGNNGWIYQINYDPATKIPSAPILLYFNSSLNFKKEFPIESMGRFENEQIQRIYWTDYNNFFRSLNIKNVDLATITPGQLDIFTDIDFKMPLLTGVTGGGALTAGQYQIAYRLITADGKETLISPPSNMVPVYSSAISGTYPAIYGNPESNNTGKSLTFTIDTSDYSEYQEIEFLSLYYETATSLPIARSIEKRTINSGPGSVEEFTYTGDEGNIFDIELFDFTSKNFAFKTFKTFTQKDNYLVGSNIKSSTISVEDLLEGGSFDARTYRYNPAGNTPFPLVGENNKLNNAFNAEFNKDKHWDVNWHTNEQFKYKSDLVTLGGDGPNISYTFHLEPKSIDADVQAGFKNQGGPFYQSFDIHDLDDGYGIRANTGFPDNTSPFITGLLKGYKRGESYRFGIIFYTLKGEATYVEYIGDIKFPDISEKDSSNNASKSPYFPLAINGPEYDAALGSNLTIGFDLGIKFTIDFNSCPNLLKNISGFQIVRAPRSISDKRRLCSGFLRTCFFNVVKKGLPGSTNDFDFTVNGSSNVVHLLHGTAEASNLFTNTTLRAFMDEQDPNTNSAELFHSIVGRKIRAQHLGFFSPELTYNFTGIRDIISEIGNNPAFLMTGVYYSDTNNNRYSQNQTTHNFNNLFNGTEAEDEGAFFDIKYKFRSTHPVTFNSIENIKRIKGNDAFDMRDSRTITIGNSTTFLGQSDNAAPTNSDMNGESYGRNFYAGTSIVTGLACLNDPGTYSTAVKNLTTRSVIARGGSNTLNLIDKYTTDPLTGLAINPLNASPVDYFLINGLTTYTPAAGNEYRQIQPFELTGVPSVNDIDLFKANPIADLLIPKIETYGGYNLNALENNNFIMAGPNIETTFGDNVYTPEIFGGDVFVSMSNVQDAQAELNQSYYQGITNNNSYLATFARNTFFPIESAINTDLDFGATTSRGVKKAVLGQEEGFYRQEDNNTSSNFGQLFPGEGQYRQFGYNEVYSKENTFNLFFIKPENLLATSLTNDVRGYLSNVKVNGELIDSWTKFPLEAYYDVDDHGPINKIINFKNNVLFFQDQAVGVYSINREAITTTDDGVPTQLGTSQGWGKHQYYSKEVGSIHQWAIAATNSAVYFFDAIHRKIQQIGGGQQGGGIASLSELKGMHSYLQFLGEDVFTRKEDGGDNPILKLGAHIGVDEINDEVIFTFLSKNAGEKGKYESLIFDELAGQFSTRFSCTPPIWINNGNTLLSSRVDAEDIQSMYTHNIGDWGNFYEIVKSCELTLVINPEADINKVLRFLEFNSIVRGDDKVIDRTKTITGFKISTETQISDNIYKTTPDSLTRIKRRFDKWRIKLPRDKDSKGRFRSTHFLLTLYFDNTYNKELIMNRLISFYDLQTF